MDVSPSLMALTWVTFIAMSVVLYKIAWKPMLRGLEMREEKIRRALADAEHAQEMAQAALADRERVVNETKEEARRILEAARDNAAATAAAMEGRTRDECRDLIETARRDIQAATEKARAQLRQESAALAVELAGRVLKQALDETGQKKLNDRLIQEIQSC